MKPDVDVAILGAGCAGLSLAAALAEAHASCSVMLFEPRTEYTRDRTWCFWDTERHPFEAAVTHRWAAWRVGAGLRSVVRGSKRYRYTHMPADGFYWLALEKLATRTDWRLCRGTQVRSVQTAEAGLLAVETDRGRVLAGTVFDSRPPFSAPQGGLLQRFFGRHIRTERECFDPETVDLMRFLPPSIPGRVRFLYVLPFARNEALVEMTYLDEPGLPEPAYAEELEAWLSEHAGPYQTLYSEQGSLPMGGKPPRVELPRGVYRIGIAGGRLKPSSGYGFLRIQRHSRAIAEALGAGGPVPARAEPPIYEALDAIFLQALSAASERAPELFLRMFERTQPDALVRFLSEKSASAREVLRVAWSLPKVTMARAAVGTALAKASA